MSIIIGITGLNGAGKSTVAQYLCTQQGFNHLSFRSYLVGKLQEMNRPENREEMRILANALRLEHGPHYVLQEVMSEAQKSSLPVVVESIRTVHEAQYLKEKNAYLLAVTAPLKQRYQRILERKSETDKVSFVEFKEAEERESSSDDIHVQNLTKVVAMADIILENSELELTKQTLHNIIQNIRSKQ